MENLLIKKFQARRAPERQLLADAAAALQRVRYGAPGQRAQDMMEGVGLSIAPDCAAAAAKDVEL